MLALWALVLAAYSNSFQAGLVFDNAAVISQDSRIRAVTPQNLRLILTGQYWHDSTTSGLYRPLTTFSYLLNYAVFGNGTHPAGYHWVNSALHGVNVSLVYLLGLLVLGAPVPAFALAALWGLHPLLTESVTNIVGRADLLAAFGVLAGLLCYVKSATALGRRKLLWVAAMVGAQAVGIFSKENAAVLPGIMLLYDLTWRGRTAWRGRALAYGALALPLAAFFCLRGTVQMDVLARFGSNPLVSAGFWTVRLTAIKVIGKYLWLFVWPARLSADYSYNAVPLFGWQPAAWEDAKALIALTVCLGAALLAVRWYRTRKPLFFFLAFFFIALAPTSNLAILIGSIMAERFVYLPAIGLAGCVVAAIYAFGRQVSRTAWIVLGLLCLACAVRTYARNFDWLDARSLWTSAVAVCPGSAKVHNNLGNALSEMPGRLPDAIAQYEVALRISPDLAEAHNNLALALAQLPGRLPDAIAEYEAALRITPDYVQAHYNLGNALVQLPGRLPDAMAQYEAALRIRPDYLPAHSNLGNALAQLPGRLPDAIAQYQAALRIEPDLAEMHNNLGAALANAAGRLPEAIAEYQTALRIKPDYLEAHYNLADALSRLPGRLGDAIAEYEAVLRIMPDYPEAQYNLGNALSQLPGRLPDAMAHYEAALRARPDYPEARYNLANILSQLPGRLPDAIAQYEAALRIRPDYAEAHNNLGLALSRIAGRLPDAIAQYRSALRIDPNYAQAHNNLGMALVNSRGQLSEAIAHFEAALRIKPDLAEVHNNRGFVLASSRGRLPEAVAHYEAALRIKPDYLQARINLGDALSQLPGRLPDALAQYEAALRIRPDPELRQRVDRLRAALK
jgi:tetratricopeptide (TPR) repeat protein